MPHVTNHPALTLHVKQSGHITKRFVILTWRYMYCQGPSGDTPSCTSERAASARAVAEPGGSFPLAARAGSCSIATAVTAKASAISRAEGTICEIMKGGG